MLILGNAVTTIKSKDDIKIFTVRGTSFEPAACDGSGVPQESGESSKTYTHKNIYTDMFRQTDMHGHRLTDC